MAPRRYYRNDPSDPMGYTPVGAQVFTRLNIAALPAPPYPRSTGRVVELCVGQVPRFLTSDQVAALLVWADPSAVVHRCIVPDARSGGRGVAFVVMADNGVAERLQETIHKRMWFATDHRCALLAKTDAAVRDLQRLVARRALRVDGSYPGDGLPQKPLTVEWSRGTVNEHVRRREAATSGTSTPMSRTDSLTDASRRSDTPAAHWPSTPPPGIAHTPPTAFADSHWDTPHPVGFLSLVLP